ncbi:MAG: alanine racemase C-terminal domain-containing protein, partial [Polyangia bacterium]
RPGLALYGYAPERSAYPGLVPVMSLKSRVVALRELPAGTRVSYGGLYRAASDARIATVPIGYADGYSRRLTGQAEALVGGVRCKIAGAVTMDMSLVDVTAAPCALGDEVVLMGAQGASRITAEDLARWSGTIPWEIFCGISKRVPRVYVGERP